MKEKKIDLLITKYGPVKDNGDIECLNREEFLEWVNNNRKKFIDNETYTNEKWVKLYKQHLANVYAEKYFFIAERI